MINRRIVIYLGVSQLISWGISYYLIGGFGTLISAETGWTRSLVYGGFSAALLMMGLTSPITGRWIDRYGGRYVMTLGSFINALGCVGLAIAHNVIAYYTAWLILGLAMRLTLYDAAFAALARMGGPHAKRPISQITLLGGLASTVFWPIGEFLAGQYGWRGALLAYAGFALLTVPLHLALPSERYEGSKKDVQVERTNLTLSRHDRLIAGSLFAVIVMLTNFLNAGMSAHMISILSGLGLSAMLSVWISTLRGIGQSSARLGEILFGKQLHPLNLSLIATFILPFSFAVGLLGGRFVLAAISFSFLYGAGNGIATITRGTVPLVLFDHRTYGAFVGSLLVPSFLLSAASPLVYAFVIERLGDGGALVLSAAIATIMFAASLLLKMRFSSNQPLSPK